MQERERGSRKRELGRLGGRIATTQKLNKVSAEETKSGIPQQLVN